MFPFSFQHKIIQRVLCILWIVLCCVSYFSLNYTNAKINAELQIQIDQKILSIEKKLEKYPNSKKRVLYKYIKRALYKRVTSENREILNYIVLWFETKLSALQNITSHNSVILRFTRWGNHQTIIDNKAEEIKKNWSVFIFRSWTIDLSLTEIKWITKKIHLINNNSLIFIDQEGWYVNRFVDFESTEQIATYFNEKYVLERMNKLSEVEKKLVKSLFPINYGYFPSLSKLWIQYDKFQDVNSKKTYLEIVAHIRLKILKNNGVNTYWLVADLNYWNPAITSGSRSFSKHIDKYKLLIDAFVTASNETEVILYLKHFPWHWAWTVDSHKWILNLSAHSEYLKENIELFNYFLLAKKNNWWLMVWHIVFNESLKDYFHSIIDKADFILTDDLAMHWYKKMTWNLTPWTVFSSFEISENSSLIKVDTQYVEGVE